MPLSGPAGNASGELPGSLVSRRTVAVKCTGR